MVAFFIHIVETGHFGSRQVLGRIQARRSCVDAYIRMGGFSVFPGRSGQADLPFRPIGSVFRLEGNSIFAVFPLDADSVFAMDHYGRTVFAVDSDGAVFAVSTFLAEHQVIIYIDFIRIGNGAFAFDGGILTVFQDRLSRRDSIFQLAEVDCVTVHCAVSHVGNLLAVRIETVFVDIGLSVNGQAAIRPKIHIFLQLHIELRSIRYNADIVICQVCRGAALDFQFFSQLFVNICAGVSAEVQAFANGVIDVCNICLIGLHAVTDCFQLVFCCRLSMYDCRVVNIPCAVGQFIHCAGACHFDCARLDVPCRSVDGDLAARRNLSAGSVYDDFLVSRAEGYFITQSDGIFFTTGGIGSFCNGYIGVLRFNGRCFCRTGDGRIQLIHIDGICPGRTGRYIGDFLVVRVETVFIDIGLSVNGQAAIRPKIHIFLQLHIELRSIRYNADIVICQVCRGAALDFQLFSQLFVNYRAGVSAEVQAFGNGVVDVCNICLIGLHAVADCFQLVFRGCLSVHDCRVVNIPCAVGQFIHCAGACHFDCARLDVPCRSVDGDLAARRNLSAGSVYDDFLVSRAEGYFITQSDGIFFTTGGIGSFRNGYIGVLRFDGRCLCRTADGRIQLTQVDCITVCRAVSHVGNLLAVRIETVFVDIGLSVNGQAAIRPKIHIFLQLHIELRSIRYNADIVICQVCRGAALDFQLFSQLFVNYRAGVSAEVQAFGNGVVDVCNICCIRILLRFGCDICQGNLFLIAFFVRYGQHHISVAVRFILALASCFRICYQMIIFLCHLGEYFAQVYIDFACVVTFQCQGFAVIGNAAACDIVVFESCHIGGETIRTSQGCRTVAVCLVVCGTACHILVFCFNNTVNIADISRIGRYISAAGYIGDLLVPCVDAGVVDLYVTYSHAVEGRIFAYGYSQLPCGRIIFHTCIVFCRKFKGFSRLDRALIGSCLYLEARFQFFHVRRAGNIIDCDRACRCRRMRLVFHFQIHFAVGYGIIPVCRVRIFNQAEICLRRSRGGNRIRHFLQLVLCRRSAVHDHRILHVPVPVVQTGYIALVVCRIDAHSGGSCRHTVQAGHIFRQFYIQRTVSGYDTDIPV